MKQVLSSLLKYTYTRCPSAFVFSVFGSVFGKLLEAASFLLLLMSVDKNAVSSISEEIYKFISLDVNKYADISLVLIFFILFNLSKLLIYQVGVWTAKLSHLVERDSTKAGYSYVITQPLSELNFGPEGVYGYVNWCPRFIARLSFLLAGSASSLVIIVFSVSIMFYLQPILSLLLILVSLIFVGFFRKTNRQAQYYGKVMKVLAKYFYKRNIVLVRSKASPSEAIDLIDSHGDALFHSFVQRTLVSVRTSYLTGLAFSVFVLICALYFLRVYAAGLEFSIHHVIIYFMAARYLFSSLSSVLSAYTKIHNLYPPVKEYFTKSYLSFLFAH